MKPKTLTRTMWLVIDTRFPVKQQIYTMVLEKPKPILIYPKFHKAIKVTVTVQEQRRIQKY